MIIEMEKVETQPVVFAGERKPEFSLISLIIAFLLGVALIVFLQFLIRDVTELLYGQQPKTPTFYRSEATNFQYDGVYYEGHREAMEAFEKAELLPYETKAILVGTFINGPLFLFALILIFSLGKLKSSYKLATRSYFIAMVINMLTLLGKLASYMYKINQRFATYGISFFLIILFTASIIYVQDKFRTKSEETSA